MRPYRVLHFPGEMTRGGVESLIMSWYRNIDRNDIQFDFCVPRFERGPLDDEIESLGGRILRCHRIRGKGVFSFVLEVCSLIKENGPYDAVHIHGVHSGVFSLIAAYLAGVSKRIYHSHSTQNLVLRNTLFRKTQEWLFSILINKFSTVRLACSKPAGQFVFSDHTFTVITNGIDIERFTPYSLERRLDLRRQLNIPEESIVIGNIARFVEGKNQDLITAIVEYWVHNKGQNIFGLFVGYGPKKDGIIRWCEEHQIEKFVSFTGNRSDTEDLYNCMDVFCLPSDFEGLGIVAIEAQACGVPCLVSLGIPEEANMKCVPFEMHDLSESIETWSNNLEVLAKTPKVSENVIRESILNKGYSFSQSLRAIIEIYQCQ